MVSKPVGSSFGTIGAASPLSLSADGSLLYNLLVYSCRWHGTPNHQLWLYTGLPATWILCLSTFPPDSGSLTSKLKCTFIWKSTMDQNSPVLFLLSPGYMFLMMFLVQEWLNTRNATDVANFLMTCLWCHTNSSLCPLLVKLAEQFTSTQSTFFPWWRFVAYPAWEGVDDCLLEHWQVSSLPHFCICMYQ